MDPLILPGTVYHHSLRKHPLELATQPRGLVNSLEGRTLFGNGPIRDFGDAHESPKPGAPTDDLKPAETLLSAEWRPAKVGLKPSSLSTKGAPALFCLQALPQARLVNSGNQIATRWEGVVELQERLKHLLQALTHSLHGLNHHFHEF